MYDDEGNYVILPDPDTLPEPGFEGMCWEEIEEMLDWMEYVQMNEHIEWLENESGWFRDYTIL